MSDYEDGKNVLRKRPEPGRPIGAKKENVIVEKKAEVDVNAIADAVVKAIGDKMPIVMHGGGTVGIVNKKDDFDNSKTLERLADSMSVHGGSEESNFQDGLGTVKTTKKDKKDVQSTIDLLSNIDEGE